MLIEKNIAFSYVNINIEDKSCVVLLHDPRSMQEGRKNDLAGPRNWRKEIDFNQ